jgi:hypothetical protein
MEIVIPIVTGLVRYYSNKQRNILYDTGSLKSQIAKMGKFVTFSCHYSPNHGTSHNLGITFTTRLLLVIFECKDYFSTVPTFKLG